MIVDLGINRE